MFSVKEHSYPLTDAEKAVLLDRSPRERRFTMQHRHAGRGIYLLMVTDRWIRLLEAQARRIEREIKQPRTGGE